MFDGKPWPGTEWLSQGRVAPLYPDEPIVLGVDLAEDRIEFDIAGWGKGAIVAEGLAPRPNRRARRAAASRARRPT